MSLDMRKNKSLVVFACAVMLCFRAGELYASDVEVSGIILDEKKGNVALINGSVVTKGDMVKGARVVDITKQGVLFNRDGEEYFLQLKVPTSGSTNLNKRQIHFSLKRNNPRPTRIPRWPRSFRPQSKNLKLMRMVQAARL